MDTVQAVCLALLQGIVEFLPISSSGHLILVPAFFDWADQGLAFDIAVHLGTLLAVVLYFRRELAAMAHGGLAGLRGRPNEDGGLAVLVIVANLATDLLYGALDPRVRYE